MTNSVGQVKQQIRNSRALGWELLTGTIPGEHAQDQGSESPRGSVQTELDKFSSREV